MGMVAKWSENCALLPAVRGLLVTRNSRPTDNLRQLIIHEVAAGVSEHAMKKTSVAAFVSNIADIVYIGGIWLI